MFQRLIVLVMLFLVAAPALTAAQSSSWHVGSVRPLSDILGDKVLPQRTYPAPDGQQVAYLKRAEDSEDAWACAVNLGTGAETCVPIPRELAASSTSDLFPALRWSPDSTRVALVGVPLYLLVDTDLGVADFTTATCTLLSNDGYEGRFFLSAPQGVIVDVQPAWSPDGTQIAVERTLTDAEGRLDVTTITIIDAATGAARDLTLLPGHEDWENDAGTVVGLEWSPDGQTLALSLRHQEFDPAYDGIWLLDVISGDLTMLADKDLTLAAYQRIYPAFGDIFALMVLRWSPDGSRLLFWTGNFGAGGDNVAWCFWIDLATREAYPVPLPSSPDDRPSLRVIHPIHAAWSPDGSALLVAALNPAPDSSAPVLYGDGDTEASLYLIDLAAQQSTLLGVLPLQPVQPYVGTWGPDGGVIIGGYAVTLVQD